MPEEDYIIPFGVADIKRPGKDITLVTYSRMVFRALEAAKELEKEGVGVEVIDLRTLSPLDIDTIVASIKKTGRLVCVSEAYEKIPDSSTKLWCRSMSKPLIIWMHPWYGWLQLTYLFRGLKTWKTSPSPIPAG